MFAESNTHFHSAHIHQHLPILASYTAPPRLSSQSSAMTTIPSLNLNADRSPPSTESTSTRSPLEAEYEATVAAHRQQAAVLAPSRKRYDNLFDRHIQIQARHEKLTETINSHRSTFQRHSRYVIFLSNMLLASNTTLRSAPRPISDLQGIMHATLLNDLRLASDTLIDMLVQCKRLDKAKAITFNQDQNFYAKCRELFEEVDRDCKKLDRLHAKLIKIAEKMGEKAECGLVAGNCAACIRNEGREAQKAVADRWMGGEKKEGGGGSGGKAREGMGKAAQAKQKLESILEE